MATMADIAQKLGVTKGTVSKALSGAPDVSDAMRQAVLETAVELGYTRLVRSGERRKLVIFIENMTWEKREDFGFGLVTGFRKMAEPGGFQVDVLPLTEQLEREQHYDSFMMDNHYLGAFFLGLTLSDPWMREFKTCRTPAVLYDNRVQGNPRLTCLGVDNEEGMEMAVHALKELGHTRIGYISGALGSYIFQLRYSAYLRALRQNSLKEDMALVGKAYHTAENLQTNLPRILSRGCTAIVCSHDQLAYSVLLHCLELGLRVPEDISIIGFDDLPLCRCTTPPLTSIRQDTDKLGRSAFQALHSQIRRLPVSAFQLHPELIVRESIGPVRTWELPELAKGGAKKAPRRGGI